MIIGEGNCEGLITFIGWMLVVVLNILGWWISNNQNKKLQNKQFEIEIGVKAADTCLQYIFDSYDKLSKLDAILPRALYLEATIKVQYRTFESKLEDWWKMKHETNEIWFAAIDSITKLIFYLEAKEVIFRKFVNMRYSLQDKTTEIQNIKPPYLFRDKYFDHFRKEINIDFAEIEKEIEPAREILFDLIVYLKDFEVSLQNEFLSNIFGGYKVPERKPEDPKHKVLKPLK